MNVTRFTTQLNVQTIFRKKKQQWVELCAGIYSSEKNKQKPNINEENNIIEGRAVIFS